MNKMGVSELLAIAPKLIASRPTLKFIFSGIGPLKNCMHDFIDACQIGDL